jgi:DNA-binding transcriptional LysR family regulator
MDEKDWVILQTIFEERNITKAAEKLYISQPALTYRLQQLEKEFGTMIVARGKRGVEFTAQGEYIAQYARSMTLQLRNTKEFVQNMGKEIRGALRIGVSGIFARYELPAILNEFISQYPNVEVNVKTGWSAESYLARRKIFISSRAYANCIEKTNTKYKGITKSSKN